MLEGDPHNYFKGYDGNLTMGILPVSLFCSGHTFFTQRMFETLKLQVWPGGGGAGPGWGGCSRGGRGHRGRGGHVEKGPGR